MAKEISYGECATFKAQRDALENNRFHAVQERAYSDCVAMVGVKKWWCVVWKKHDELTEIQGAITKVKAEKLASALNFALNK